MQSASGMLESHLFGENKVPFLLPVATGFAVYGAYRFARSFFGAMSFVRRHYLRWQLDLYKRYASNKDSYVVVTGGSDGIGLELCHQMAAIGFNICMIARNEEKMQTKLNELTQSYPNVKTMYIVADFAHMHTIQEYRETIRTPLEQIDIAMLFLNAGVGNFGPFEEIKDGEVEEVVSCNAAHTIYTAKVLLDKLVARETRSAIVVTSTGLRMAPLAGCATYSATKTFVSFLAISLSYELEAKNIDVMNWDTGRVATKFVKKQTKGRVTTTDVAVKGMLRDLGRERSTYGPMRHELSMLPLSIVPLHYINPWFFRALTKDYHKRMAEAKKQD